MCIRDSLDALERLLALIDQLAAQGIQIQHLDLGGGLGVQSVSYTHLRAHETVLDLVCRLLLEKKKDTIENINRTYALLHVMMIYDQHLAVISNNHQ
mgnify:CR=1 FL=1